MAATSYSWVGWTASTVAGSMPGGIGDSEELVQVSGGRRRQPFGELDPPGEIGGPAVVVVHQKTADPAERVGRRQCRRGDLHGPAERHPAGASR